MFKNRNISPLPIVNTVLNFLLRPHLWGEELCTQPIEYSKNSYLEQRVLIIHLHFRVFLKFLQVSLKIAKLFKEL